MAVARINPRCRLLGFRRLAGSVFMRLLPVVGRSGRGILMGNGGFGADPELVPDPVVNAVHLRKRGVEQKTFVSIVAE